MNVGSSSPGVFVFGEVIAIDELFMSFLSTPFLPNLQGSPGESGARIKGVSEKLDSIMEYGSWATPGSSD